VILINLITNLNILITLISILIYQLLKLIIVGLSKQMIPTFFSLNEFSLNTNFLKNTKWEDILLWVSYNIVQNVISENITWYLETKVLNKLIIFFLSMFWLNFIVCFNEKIKLNTQDISSPSFVTRANRHYLVLYNI